MGDVTAFIVDVATDLPAIQPATKATGQEVAKSVTPPMTASPAITSSWLGIFLGHGSMVSQIKIGTNLSVSICFNSLY